MDSFPIPESDSLLAQAQAGIDLQQEGLSAVLGSIGATVADNLQSQKAGIDKCKRKLQKEIKDNLAQQNAQLVSVIDQLLGTINSLIAEQGVALAQLRTDTGIVFGGGTPAQQGNLQSGQTPATVRQVEGPLPVLPNVLSVTLPPPGTTGGQIATIPERTYFPPVTTPGQNNNGGKTGPASVSSTQGQSQQQQSGQIQPGLIQSAQDITLLQQQQGSAAAAYALAPSVTQSIGNVLASLNLTIANAPDSILSTIVSLVASTVANCQSVQQQPIVAQGGELPTGSKSLCDVKADEFLASKQAVMIIPFGTQKGRKASIASECGKLLLDDAMSQIDPVGPLIDAINMPNWQQQIMPQAFGEFTVEGEI